MKHSLALSTLLAASAVMVLPAYAQAPKGDVVDVAMSNPKFSTLVSLVKKAGLVETLKGKGPFTVFAPTNEAFAKVPKPLLDKVGNDPALLKKVLTYHVIAGKVMSTDLKTMSAKTVEGESIVVKVKGKNVMFNNAKPVMVDVPATNGVIHAIDTVLLPPSLKKGK